MECSFLCCIPFIAYHGRINHAANTYSRNTIFNWLRLTIEIYNIFVCYHSPFDDSTVLFVSTTPTAETEGIYCADTERTTSTMCVYTAAIHLDN